MSMCEACAGSCGPAPYRRTVHPGEAPGLPHPCSDQTTFLLPIFLMFLYYPMFICPNMFLCPTILSHSLSRSQSMYPMYLVSSFLTKITHRPMIIINFLGQLPIIFIMPSIMLPYLPPLAPTSSSTSSCSDLL